MNSTERVDYCPWFAWPELVTILLSLFLLAGFSLGSSLPLWEMIQINIWPLVRILTVSWFILRAIDMITGGPRRRLEDYEFRLLKARDRQIEHERQQARYESNYRP